MYSNYKLRSESTYREALHTYQQQQNTGSRLSPAHLLSRITTAELIIIIMVSISLQPESGYVFLVVAGTAILNMYQMLKVNNID